MSFERDMQRVEQGLNDGVNKLIVETALAILQTVVLATPVGDPNLWKPNKSGTPRKPPPGYAGGRARGNWQVSIGSEETNVKEVRDKGGFATVSEGKTELKRFRPPWKKIFISNNVPYAQRLNDGHSKQAPAGFVERAVQAGIFSLEGRGDIFQ
jgi:hypothetical protein